MKKRILALALILLTLNLSGCSASFTDGGNMMRPPRATGDKADIQNIIETKAGAGFTFCYPQTGDYRSAVTMQDIDNDGSDEAIALYTAGSDSTKFCLMIMTKTGGTWKSIGSFTVSASGVDRLLFSDLNGDSRKELMVGWTSLGSNEKQLTVYSYEDDLIREMTVDSTYSELAAADFDNDGQSELILFTIAGANEGSLAKFFKYSTREKRPMLSSSVQLDPEPTRIVNVTTGMVDSTTRAVFLDGEIQSGAISTQIIFWNPESEQLENPLYNPNKSANNTSNISTRSSSTICKDINDDGIIEVPSAVTMPAGDKEDTTSICTLTTWNAYQRKTNSFSGVLNMVISYKEGYYLILPDKWLSDSGSKWSTFVTARVNNDNRTMTFYEWRTDDGSGSIGDKLFTIYVYTQGEWDTIESESRIKIRKTENLVYAVKIENTKNKLALTEDEIKECFKLIGQAQEILSSKVFI